MDTGQDNVLPLATRRPKVLVVAYACDPSQGSEPGVAWNMVGEIARFADPVVLVSSRYRKNIEREIEAKALTNLKNVRWVYTDPPSWAMWIKNRFHLGTQIHYVLWQWFALSLARQLHLEDRFDLAHHLTYGVTWIAPTIQLLSIPFIWGPIGGGDIVPSPILSGQSWRRRTQEKVYWLLTNVLIHIEPFSLLSRRKAGIILFRSRSTEMRFPKTHGARRIVMSETACRDLPMATRVTTNDEYLHIVGIGRMEYWKAYRWAIKGFHRYLQEGGRGELTLLGDGPDMGYIEEYCRKAGLTQVVKLPGRVSREHVQRALNESDVLIHPSYRDGGSWSVLEALGAGLPVVCANASGVADMVDDTCGIRIDARTADDLVHGISQAFLMLSRSPELRARLGKGARQRVYDHYRWPQRGEKLRELYQQMIVRQ